MVEKERAIKTGSWRCFAWERRRGGGRVTRKECRFNIHRTRDGMGIECSSRNGYQSGWNDPPLEHSMETGESKEKKREGIEVTREKGWRLIFRGERRNLATITQERKEGIGMWFPTLRTFSWIARERQRGRERERERERQLNDTREERGTILKTYKTA